MDDGKKVLGLAQGDRISGRYEILDLLGMGGFAAVFRAHDTQIERDVAIKVLNITALTSQGTDLDTTLARFHREAKLAARISHPCVVEIYDYGVLDEDDNPYIIMEVLEGHDLETELEEHGPLDPERAIPLFIDCLEALGDAHQEGIVHKDLKPSNLFIANPDSRRETLKLVDFGIAHLGDAPDSRLTRTGFMLGTPQYMAPEYVEEQSVSPGVDVYQMGLILVEALSGRPVVDEENPWKCSLMHVSRELQVPTGLLSSPLGSVINTALALEVDQRFENATAFADALEAIDPATIPTIATTAIQWQRLDVSSSEIEAPDSQTRQLIEEAHSARQKARADTGATQAGDEEDRITAEQRPPSSKMSTPSIESAAPSEVDLTVPADSMAPDTNLYAVLGILAMASVVALLGVLVLWNGEEPDEDHQPPELTALNDEPESATDGDADEDIDHVAEDNSTPGEEEEVELEIVEVRATPAEAVIEADGVELGSGLAEVIFGDDIEEVDLAVTHDDFEPFRESVGPADGPIVEVELERLPSPEVASPTPRPDPEPVRPAQPDPEPDPPPPPEEPDEEPDEIAQDDGDADGDGDVDGDGEGFLFAP